jgi:hypothetical protein
MLRQALGEDPARAAFPISQDRDWKLSCCRTCARKVRDAPEGAPRHALDARGDPGC